MRGLSDAMLLTIWERGHGLGPVRRALVLLVAASPSLDAVQCVEVSIGERDAAVLRLRRATFGPRLPARTDCPKCGERLEFELDIDRLALGGPAQADLQVVVHESLRFRLPNSGDLLAASGCANEEDAARAILMRCCLAASQPQELPAATVADVAARMAALEAGADIRLQLACAACRHAWSDHLDIARYFWEEIEHAARALLDDVHRLARSYGWDEQSILGMSRDRRTAYLERCNA
jgi:hypothetical protein